MGLCVEIILRCAIILLGVRRVVILFSYVGILFCLQYLKKKKKKKTCSNQYEKKDGKRKHWWDNFLSRDQAKRSSH